MSMVTRQIDIDRQSDKTREREEEISFKWALKGKKQKKNKARKKTLS